jgi:cell division protein FtsI (penicillin-binding protein 3)
MAQLVGVDEHKAFLKKMGILTKATLELPEIGYPLIPKPWREINTMTIAYGYGLSASSIQMARAMGAVINGGYLIEPTLLKRKDGEEIKKTHVISEKTSRLVRTLMRLVITDGTGRKAVAPGYEVFGKTGTANQVISGKYQSNHVKTTFIGGFPFSNPKYLIMVTLDDPRSTKETYGYTTAGWNAAPLAGKIIRRMAPVVGIKPVLDEGERAKDHMHLVQTKGILYENR